MISTYGCYLAPDTLAYRQVLQYCFTAAAQLLPYTALREGIGSVLKQISTGSWYAVGAGPQLTTVNSIPEYWIIRTAHGRCWLRLLSYCKAGGSSHHRVLISSKQYMFP